MKILAAATLALLVNASVAVAQSGNVVADTVQGAITELNETGANLTFESSETAGDGTLILRNVVMAPDDGEVSIRASFVRATPTGGTPNEITFTISDTVTIDIEDEGIDPISIEVSSVGLEFATDWLTERQTVPNIVFRADLLEVNGGDEEHSHLKQLASSQKDIAFELNFNPATRDGLLSLSLGDAETDLRFFHEQYGQEMSFSSSTSAMNYRIESKNTPDDPDDFFEDDRSIAVAFGFDDLTIKTDSPSEETPVNVDITTGPTKFDFDLSVANELVAFAFDLAAEDLDAGYSVLVPGEEGAAIATSYKYPALSANGNARNIPVDEDALPDFLDKDGHFEVFTATSGGTFDVSAATSDFPMNVTGSTGPSESETSFRDGVFIYNVNAADIKYNVEIDPQIFPLPPVDASIADITFDIRVPLRPTGRDEVVNFDVALRDLEVSEVLWDMGDPQKTIPRGPVTLEIDLGALVDIQLPIGEATDLDGIDDVNDPMEIASLKSFDVTRLFLTIGGAIIDGSGGGTVDNSGPFPVPNGSVDLAINGVQSLGANLVDLGLIEPLQMGMLSGLLTAFAVPGDNPDTYTTKVEFKDGGVVANGVPLQ